MILSTDKDAPKTNEHSWINETLTKKQKHKCYALNILQGTKTHKASAPCVKWLQSLGKYLCNCLQTLHEVVNYKLTLFKKSFLIRSTSSLLQAIF